MGGSYQSKVQHIENPYIALKFSHVSPLSFFSGPLSFPGTAYHQTDETDFQNTKVQIGNEAFWGLSFNSCQMGKITSPVTIRGMLGST